MFVASYVYLIYIQQTLNVYKCTTSNKHTHCIAMYIRMWETYVHIYDIIKNYIYIYIYIYIYKTNDYI